MSRALHPAAVARTTPGFPDRLDSVGGYIDFMESWLSEWDPMMTTLTEFEGGRMVRRTWWWDHEAGLRELGL